MNRTASGLREVLDEQNAQLQKLRNEIETIESTDYISRNDELKKELTEKKETLAALTDAHQKLKEENSRLKENLVSQLYAQKLDVLRASKGSVYKAYRAFEDGEHAGLRELEGAYSAKMAAIRDTLQKNKMEGRASLDEKLAESQSLLDALLMEQRARLESEGGRLSESVEGEYTRLEEAPLTDEQIKRQMAGHNIEQNFGGRITNVLGMLMIVVGVVLGLQYSYTRFLVSAPLKSAAAFALGILFLAAGELLGRKKRSLFSLGVTSGGIAILFASAGVSYFVLGVLPRHVALLVCVLITVAAFILSLRYQSRMIANFAIVGGYLPIYAVSFGEIAILYSAMAYFVLLNLFALLVSAKRDWDSVKYTSFGLNTLGMLAIVSIGHAPFAVNLSYVMANFAMYVFISILYPMRHEKPIRTGAYAVIALNTFMNCLFVFGLIAAERLTEYLGLAALCVALFYFLFLKYLEKRLRDTKITGLFLVTSLVFAVLVIPLQLDAEWISLGWLAEAVALVIIGILNGEKWYKRIGGATFLLCLAAFCLFDFFGYHDAFYIMKATAIAAGSVAILAAALHKHRAEPYYMITQRGRAVRWYKNFAMAVVGVYIFLLAGCVAEQTAQGYISEMWISGTLIILLSAAYGSVLCRVKVIQDRVTEVFSGCLYGLGCFVCLYMNTVREYDLEMGGLFLLIFIVYNTASFFSLWEAASILVRKGKLSRTSRVFALFLFLLAVVMEILLFQYQLDFNNMIISFVLVGAALLLILYGFRFRAPYIRRFGLGLEIAGVMKFFLVDLFFLGAGQRIVSYFVLGAALVGISFVYQLFSRRSLDGREDGDGEA